MPRIVSHIMPRLGGKRLGKRQAATAATRPEILTGPGLGLLVAASNQ